MAGRSGSLVGFDDPVIFELCRNTIETIFILLAINGEGLIPKVILRCWLDRNHLMGLVSSGMKSWKKASSTVGLKR